MDELNQWHLHSKPEPEDGLAYMYQQEEEHAGMKQRFAESLPEQEQQQYYTSPPASAPNPFHPSRSRSSGLPSLYAGSAPPNLSFRAAEPSGQPSSWSSSIVLSFGGQASTLSFSRGSGWLDGIDVVQQQAPERRSRAPLNAQEHVIAERRRREKMQQHFVALATILPDLTKTDKISLLGRTIEYVKELEEKVKFLEEQSARRTSASAVFQSTCRVVSAYDDASPVSGEIAAVASWSSHAVEASVHGDTVLLKMCCEEKRGVLVMVLSELERQGLSIENASVLPFTDSCFNITITAKIGEGFSSTAELVNNLTMAIRGFT